MREAYFVRAPYQTKVKVLDFNLRHALRLPADGLGQPQDFALPVMTRWGSMIGNGEVHFDAKNEPHHAHASKDKPNINTCAFIILGQHRIVLVFDFVSRSALHATTMRPAYLKLWSISGRASAPCLRFWPRSRHRNLVATARWPEWDAIDGVRK